MISRDEGSSVAARSGNDPSERVKSHGPTAAPEEVYGPIRLRRYAKGDGRALILYTHGAPADGGPAHEGDGSSSAHEGHERA
jgi:hypothetical protein